MTVSEKVAYLKGLSEGLNLDDSSKEGKLILAIIDTLGDVAAKLEDLDENDLDLGEEIDAISDDLAQVEDVLFGDEDADEDEDEDDYPSCGCGHHHCGTDYDEDEEAALYEVKCPACGNEITVDEEVLGLGSIECPNCGEKLEFEFDEDEDGEEE